MRTGYTNDKNDGRVHHRINQYVIKDEIGRGSYGAVYLATNHQGTQFVWSPRHHYVRRPAS